MKKAIIGLLLSIGILSASAQKTDHDLRFDSEGNFKIVQFTDVHYRYGWEASKTAIENITKVLETERPDLVVFTGDVICDKPAGKGLDEVLSVVENFGVPFVVTQGNHDDEQDMSREEIYSYIQKYKNNIPTSSGDATLEITDGEKTAAVVYTFDSNAYAQVKGIGTYGWITLDQINSYVAESKRLTETNGGTPLPALAFFHIPLPEYKEASMTDGAHLIGTRREKVCSPVLNSGLFTAMRTAGDVMGVFVGHDHNNDYTVYWQGILLGYGRYSGGNTIYNNLRAGARVIVMHKGERTFDTWLRLRDGSIVDPTVYPASYINDDWKDRKAPI
ncbi:MAG: metallophosphoesterase family protein [Muribaculaceae bacterium]|nr:metallophosphoesterase family protein [Muribaculaceae bacterium]MDE6610920.1 metallophosphoesterase family protein [Muribaculaceae bacterium]